MSDDTTHKTVQKTLWSDTLIEMLIVALKKNRSDDQIIELLKEIRGKNFEAKYVTGKIRKELDNASAERVKNLMRKI
ncbi:MAG: hypothetical protein MI673_05645 [Thiotrichales bacterium]|nr:hypothetical protein [Thiotrichales bacterium]